MTVTHFEGSLKDAAPPPNLTAPVEALWWDAKGDWRRAHALVDELETQEGMAVHAYLHRAGGEDWNAEYWYKRAGRSYYHSDLKDEWRALVEGLANLSNERG